MPQSAAHFLRTFQSKLAAQPIIQSCSRKHRLHSAPLSAVNTQQVRNLVFLPATSRTGHHCNGPDLRQSQPFLAAASSSARMSAKLSGSDKQDSPILAQTDRGPERTSASEDGNSGQIVQYLVIRKDLVDVDKWPLGALLAQASHAAVAAVWLNKEDPATIEYCSGKNLDNMHKVRSPSSQCGWKGRGKHTTSIQAWAGSAS
jgi:hypothetical protein